MVTPRVGPEIETHSRPAYERAATTLVVPVAILEVVRHIVAVLPGHLAHGHGEMTIVVTPGNVDVQEGKRRRFKINA